jgi:hypothetical protein
VCCHCFPDDVEVVSMLHLHIRQGTEIVSHYIQGDGYKMSEVWFHLFSANP